jgi:hypothetical protein
MQTCLICLDDDNNLINPKHCSCKVYLHQKCLFMIGSYGLLCPICRIKTSNKPTYILPHIFNNQGSIIDRILYSPIVLFIKHPNFITFIIAIILSFCNIFCFILPMSIFEMIKFSLYRNLFFRNEVITLQID